MRAWILGIVFLSFWACEQSKETLPEVSVSILPLRYFVERVAGNNLHVNVMIPSGMNPVAMDLTMAQLKALSKSSIYFAVGNLPFEEVTLYPVLRSLENLRLVRHTEGMSREIQDPHVWMSPVYVKQMVHEIARVLSDKFPQKREVFIQNRDRFLVEVDSIDREAKRILVKKEQRAFLIYHPVLTYFARDYGLEQIVLENGGKEPQPVQLKAIIDSCRQKGVQLVFIQRQFDETNARSVAKAIDGEVVVVDPLNENWKGEMTRLLNIIADKM